MKLNFRQGIARHQTDVNGNATFLQRSASNSQFIDLIVSPDQTTISFAHRAATYVLDELKTIPRAWSIAGTGTKYLYWDLNILTGALTRGVTVYAPYYTSGAPTNPAVDQYWFDTVENVGRVWNGKKWIEVLRVFAGYVTSNSVIHAARVGSEAGLVGEFEAGYVVLDSFGFPLRQSNGTFVTTGTWLNVSNVGITSTRIEESIMSGLAAEEIPKFSLVQLRKGRRLVLARSTDYTSRVSGIVSTDLYQGEVDVVISTGVVRNEEWSFKDSQIDRPVFCGPTGEVTLTPPHTGVLQQVGFVYDTNAIFMGLKQVIVLDPPGYILPPPNPTLIPAANFSASVVSGSAPLQVQFTNSSTGGLSYEWDFTNDGFVDTTEENPTYTFSAPGIYTVRLRAINGELYNDKVQANVIVVTDPTSVPGNVNLGISFGAPARVDAGTAFSFQVFSVNNGSIKATHVQRVIKLRSSDGSAVTLVNSPPGSLLDIQGPITQITLPEISILPGAPPSTAVLKVLSAATARAIQLDGTVVSSETDSTPQDNSASTTVMVHA